ncbi:MAG TPA: PKD domain-containing protein [Flavobacteriales bacterium]|nr:PKD domain-containing protein [Flavobacteriales bacterium]
MATCVKCGKLNYEGVKICTSCGTPLPVSEPTSYSDSDSGSQYDDSEMEDIQDNDNSSNRHEEAEETVEKRPINKRLIFIVIGILAVIGIGIGIYFMASGSSDKLLFSVTPVDSLRKVNTTLTFVDSTKGAETWVWDFGDGSEEEFERVVTHVYTVADTYMVYLTVNSKLRDSLQVIIHGDNAPTLVPDEFIPDMSEAVITASPSGAVQVGETVTFTDHTPGAKTWKWYFNENGRINSTTNPATYKFTIPKKKRVITVNNDVGVTGTYELDIIDNKAAAPAKTESPAKEKAPEKVAKEAAKPAEKPAKVDKEGDLKFLQNAFNALASKNKKPSDDDKEKIFLKSVFNETDLNRVDVSIQVSTKGRNFKMAISEVITEIIFTKPKVKVKKGVRNGSNTFQDIEIEY